MPKPTVPEFWNLLGQSRLLPSDRLADLQKRFGQMRGAAQINSPVLAEWLIAEGAITPFHRDVLLKGMAGPFHYADFVVHERIRAGRLKGCYRALHQPTRHPVLLVFFSGRTVSESAEWSAVQRAAASSFRANSPHLSCCHEIVDFGKFKFAVLDDLPGRRLTEITRPGYRMPVGQACSIVRQLALGLVGLHATGESHGDVRPDNILISDDGRAVLLGFPMSRGSFLSRAPLDAVSAEYAAPEVNQIQPNPTPASDFYAAGCVLYELLSGFTPFASKGAPESVPRKMARHASEPIVPLQQAAAAPEALNEVVSYMMAKNVAVRYQEGNSVAEALLPFVDPQFVNLTHSAAPTFPAYEATARGRRDSVLKSSSSVPARPTVPSTQPQSTGRPTTSPAVPTAGNGTSPASSPITNPAPVVAASAVAATGASAVAATPVAGGNASGSQQAAVAPIPQGASDPGHAPSLDQLFSAAGQPASASATGIGSPTAATAGAGNAAQPAAVPGTSRRLPRKTKNTIIAVASALALFLLIGVFYMMDKSEPNGTSTVSADNPEGEAGEETAHDGSAADNGVATNEPNGSGSVASPTSLPPDDIVVKSSDSAPPRRLRETIIPDDGSSLWASPTQSVMPDLRYIAPNPHIVLMIRAGEFFPTAAGRQVLDSMQASGFDFDRWMRQLSGFGLDEIQRIDFAFYEQPGRPAVIVVVRTRAEQTKEALVQRWQNPSQETYQGAPYWMGGRNAYYVPAGATNVFAVADEAKIKEVIDMLDEPAWLSRPFEALLRAADTDRHVNLLFATNYVRSARDALYPGRLRPLHNAFSWFLGPTEDVQAGLLSIHAGGALFAEMRFFAGRDKNPSALARDVYDRLGQSPSLLNQHLFELQISAYSRQVLARFPDMIRLLHKYTRNDRDQPAGQQAVLRAYLPGGAAPLLALATDLALLESAGTNASAGVAVAATPKSLGEKLKRRTTLTFQRDNLINAVKLLSDDIGVNIEIQGNDLQLEGITKNQSFGIDLQDKSAEEILLNIVLLANPDKTVKKPSDAGQKLIYVLKENQDGGDDVIWITTRAAAEGRGDDIPAVFKES